MTRLPWVLTGVALAVLATGCGGDESPADAVPALSAQLDRVDAAISSGRSGAARSALDDLADETEQAREDGTLDADDADAILEAISTLEEQLPGPAGQPSATPMPTPSATPSATTSETPSTEDEQADEKPEPKPDKPGKPDKKDEKDKGPKHDKPGHGHGHGHGKPGR